MHLTVPVDWIYISELQQNMFHINKLANNSNLMAEVGLRTTIISVLLFMLFYFQIQFQQLMIQRGNQHF